MSKKIASYLFSSILNNINIKEKEKDENPPTTPESPPKTYDDVLQGSVIGERMNPQSGKYYANNLKDDENPSDPLKDKLTYLYYLEKKIDMDLGFFYWKKYVAATVWANISLPINLSITLLTAITTAQATNSDLLSHNTYVNISIFTLLLTTLNTFFRPHQKLNENLELVKKWNELGTEFETIYYTLDKTKIHIDATISQYRDLQLKINTLRQNESPATINFFTDIIHIIAKFSCLRKYDKWLDMNRNMILEDEDETKKRLLDDKIRKIRDKKKEAKIKAEEYKEECCC